MKFIAPTIKQRFLDQNSAPLAGGKLYTYASGSTTPRASFKDKIGTPNTNPVILNANGECDLWLSAGEYKITLTDANDVHQWTVDDVGASSTGASETQSVSNVLSGGWFAPEGSGATQGEEFGFKVFKLPNPQNVENINVRRRVKVPESYTGGDIEIKLGAYTPSFDENPFDEFPIHAFQAKLTASLIRKPTVDAEVSLDEIGFEVNDLALSESQETRVNGFPATFEPPATIIPGKPNVYRLVTFVISGTIDGQAVSAGDFIDLKLERTAIPVEIPEVYAEDANDIRIIEDFMEVIFS